MSGTEDSKGTRSTSNSGFVQTRNGAGLVDSTQTAGPHSPTHSQPPPSPSNVPSSFSNPTASSQCNSNQPQQPSAQINSTKNNLPSDFLQGELNKINAEIMALRAIVTEQSVTKAAFEGFAQYVKDRFTAYEGNMDDFLNKHLPSQISVPIQQLRGEFMNAQSQNQANILNKLQEVQQLIHSSSQNITTQQWNNIQQQSVAINSNLLQETGRIQESLAKIQQSQYDSQREISQLSKTLLDIQEREKKHEQQLSHIIDFQSHSQSPSNIDWKALFELKLTIKLSKKSEKCRNQVETEIDSKFKPWRKWLTERNIDFKATILQRFDEMSQLILLWSKSSWIISARETDLAKPASQLAPMLELVSAQTSLCECFAHILKLVDSAYYNYDQKKSSKLKGDIESHLDQQVTHLSKKLFPQSMPDQQQQQQHQQQQQPSSAVIQQRIINASASSSFLTSQYQAYPLVAKSQPRIRKSASIIVRAYDSKLKDVFPEIQNALNAETSADLKVFTTTMRTDANSLRQDLGVTAGSPCIIVNLLQIETRKEPEIIRQVAQDAVQAFNGNAITVLVYERMCAAYSESQPEISGTLLKAKYFVDDRNGFVMKLEDSDSQFRRSLVDQIKKML